MTTYYTCTIIINSHISDIIQSHTIYIVTSSWNCSLVGMFLIMQSGCPAAIICVVFFSSCNIDTRSMAWLIILKINGKCLKFEIKRHRLLRLKKFTVDFQENLTLQQNQISTSFHFLKPEISTQKNYTLDISLRS